MRLTKADKARILTLVKHSHEAQTAKLAEPGAISNVATARELILGLDADEQLLVKLDPPATDAS